MNHQIRKQNETVEVLVDVCSETKSQFKRILDTLDEYDEAAFKRARSYASAGVVYAESCIQRYNKSSLTMIPWADCFKVGKEKGYFKTYKNKDRLKATYYELRKK